MVFLTEQVHMLTVTIYLNCSPVAVVKIALLENCASLIVATSHVNLSHYRYISVFTWLAIAINKPFQTDALLVDQSTC